MRVILTVAIVVIVSIMLSAPRRKPLLEPFAAAARLHRPPRPSLFSHRKDSPAGFCLPLGRRILLQAAPPRPLLLCSFAPLLLGSSWASWPPSSPPGPSGPLSRASPEPGPPPGPGACKGVPL